MHSKHVLFWWGRSQREMVESVKGSIFSLFIYYDVECYITCNCWNDLTYLFANHSVYIFFRVCDVNGQHLFNDISTLGNTTRSWYDTMQKFWFQICIINGLQSPKTLQFHTAICEDKIKENFCTTWHKW